MSRRSGTLFFSVDGTQYEVVGNWTYNLGAEKREALVGHDAVHGYKATPQAPYFEGEVRDRGDLALKTLLELDGVTATLELANGKAIVLRDAWYAADGNVGTEEANVQVRLEGLSAEEIR